MKKIILKKENFNKINECVACIGTFDGFHLGHQELLNKTIEIANKKNIKSAVITFDKEPSQLFDPNFSRIISLKEKEEYCQSNGIDYFIIIKFNKLTMNVDYKDFLNNYLNAIKINTLICGFDFTFGKNGKGNIKALKQYGKFKTIVIDEKKYYGRKISTTRIKEAYYNGNFNLVNRLLGREYILSLKVLECSKNNKQYFIKCKPIDNKPLKIKDGKYDDFEVNNGCYYINSPLKVDVSEKVLIIFEESYE